MLVGRWIAFFLVNLLICGSWLAVQDRKKTGISTRLLVAAVLSGAQILASIFLLGLPWAKLTALNLIILNILISGTLLAYTRRRRDLLGSVSDLVRAVTGAVNEISSDILLKILAVLMALTIIWLIGLAVIYPPLEWDSLMYHLPAVGHYIQQESIIDPTLPMDAYSEFGIDGSVWVNSFPKNIELLFLWATLLPGNDTLVDLVQMFFGLMGVVAVYVLAARLGVPKKWAMVAGFLFFLTPIVIAQSRSNMIDLCNGALILAALALLYSRDGRRNHQEVIVAGIAAGIVLGAKWSGLLFLSILWLMLIGQRLYWNHRYGLPRFLKTINESLYFLGPALIFGAYWYLKNWYLYGNPLWPFRISVLGQKIMDGVITSEAVLIRTFPEQLEGLNFLQMLLVSWRETLIYGYDYDMKLGGLGPFWFIFALPAIFYLMRWFIRRRDLAQALVFIAPAAMLLLHPENWWTRYTLFIAGLGAVAFVKIRSSNNQVNITRIIDLMVIFTVVFSTIASWTASYYIPSKIQGLLAKEPALRTSTSVRPELVSQAYDHINSRTLDNPANIAYGVGLDFTYPLWGSDLRNRVYFVDLTTKADWIKKLRHKRIKYLFVKTDGPEQQFIKQSSLFERTFFDQRGGFEVYAFSG